MGICTLNVVSGPDELKVPAARHSADRHVSRSAHGSTPGEQVDSVPRPGGRPPGSSTEETHGRLTDIPTEPLDFGATIARNLREIRLQTGWTQASLATAMERLGFGWKRATVAEVEGGSRRVSLEELLALAVLYAVPMVELLLPIESEPIRWTAGSQLSSTQIRDLLYGVDDGPDGEQRLIAGGPGWTVAADVAGSGTGQGDWRPASDLWRELRRLAVAQRWNSLSSLRSPAEADAAASDQSSEDVLWVNRYKTGQRVPVTGVYVDQHGNETVHTAHKTFPPTVHRNGGRGEQAIRQLKQIL